MSLHLVTPWAGLVVLAVVLPVAASVLLERRADRARLVLGLAAPSRRARLAVPAAAALAVVLVALAASQPVIASRRSSTIRRGADVFVVLDTSRSMVAARAPGAPTRFARARTIARRLVDELPTVPVGLASLTDRVLPYVFPTASRRDLDAVLREAIGIERPPPASRQGGGVLGRATSLAVLADLGDARYFASERQRRIAVVLTDGESRPFDPETLRRSLRQAGIEIVFVRVWDPAERVWVDGAPAKDYRPDPSSGLLLAQLARDVGGAAFSERETGAVVAFVRASLGRGRPEAQTTETGSTQLAPFAAAAALLPLGLVLWRRNLA